MTAAASDHGPILLTWRQDAGQWKRRGKKIFKYEVMWESHENFTPWMSNAWQEEEKARTVQESHRKLMAVQEKARTVHFDGWGRPTFGHVRLELQRLKEELEQLQDNPSRTGPSHREIKITDRIVELNYREEIMWQ